MAELFRLAYASVLFGGALYLSLRIAGLILHLPAFSKKEIPPLLYRHLPAGWEDHVKRKERHSFGKIGRFFLDLLACIVCGISFIIFLFWKADGIPRLFVFCAAGGGAYITKRLTDPLLLRFEKWLKGLIGFCLLWALVPLLRIFSHLISFFQKIGFFFIKCGKRFYTICAAKKYVKRAEERLKGAKALASMRESIVKKVGK